jgi:hypothetical protein
MPSTEESYPISWYVDSGAGQSISSCSGAFSFLQPCAIVVVGVAGSMPVHGMGTASFVTSVGGDQEVILVIHNCLLCHGEVFNLLSVSQLLRTTSNSVVFSGGNSKIHLNQHDENKHQTLSLTEEDGPYSISMQPISANDKRHTYLAQCQ